MFLQVAATAAQLTELSGTVTGRDDRPFAGAQVTVVGTAIGAVTSSRGQYHMRLESGAYRLCLRFPGEFPVPDSVVISGVPRLTKNLAFVAPAPGRTYPSCVPAESTFVVASGGLHSAVISADPDVADGLPYATLTTAWAEVIAGLGGRRSDSALALSGFAKGHPPLYLLVPPDSAITATWIRALLAEGWLDGLCHATAPAGCTSDVLATYIHVDSMFALGTDSAVAALSWVSTFPTACRRGDAVPYVSASREWLFVLENYEWHRRHAVSYWPVSLDSISFSESSPCTARKAGG